MTLLRCFFTSVLPAINLACVGKTQVVQTPRSSPEPDFSAAPGTIIRVNADPVHNAAFGDEVLLDSEF